MDVSSVQTNTPDKLALANIQDYLEDKVGLNEYHQRKLLCDELSTRLSHSQSQPTMLVFDALAPQQVLQTNSKTDETDVTTARLLRNSLVDEAMSPASVDSAYSSSPPSPPLHYNQDSSYSSRVQDNINEDTRTIWCNGSPLTSRDQQACPGFGKEALMHMSKGRTNSSTALHDQKMSSPESFKRQTTKPMVRQPNNKLTSLKRVAADTDEPDNKPAKKKRNRGPKPRVMPEGNGPMQLWQLVLKLLVGPPASEFESGLVEWTKEQKYGFRILQPDALAKLWGEHKKKPLMNFDKLARSLRYYYDKSMLRKVPGKENTYEFTWDISEMLGYDPVHGAPVSDPVRSNATPVPSPASGSPVPNQARGSPVPNQAHGLPVSYPVHESSTSDPTNGLPVSTPLYGLPVSKPADQLPVTHTVPRLPSNPMNAAPGSNLVEALSAFSSWLPVFDPGDSLPIPDPVTGEPVSYAMCGWPVSEFQAYQIPTPTPLDFTMLVESDHKSNFYEVL